MYVRRAAGLVVCVVTRHARVHTSMRPTCFVRVAVSVRDDRGIADRGSVGEDAVMGSLVVSGEGDREQRQHADDSADDREACAPQHAPKTLRFEPARQTRERRQQCPRLQ
jgi:hypothetical protein